jgi:DNA primase
MLNKFIRGRLYSYVTNTLGLREYTRGWMKGNCPHCGREDKYGVNLYLNRTNCFRCGYHPSPIILVMEIESFSEINEAWSFLKAYEGREYLEPVVEKVEQIDAVLPEGFKSLLLGEGRLGRSARNYVDGRGFDPEEMSYKGWGYGTKDKYFGYIIIPFYVGGKLIYYNARRYLGSGPKYMNPEIEDFGLGKSLIMYNIDALALYDTVYLTEGAINAETMGDQGIATGGKKISHYQVSMILKSDVESIIILLDPDAMGDAINVGLGMAYYKKLKLIELPGDQDVNDLGQKKTLRYVNRSQWLNYNDLLKMKHDT